MSAAIRQILAVFVGAAILFAAFPLYADDGYDLWLGYHSVGAGKLKKYRKTAAEIVAPGGSATAAIARNELKRGLGGLLEETPKMSGKVDADGAILIGTPAAMPAIASLDLPLQQAGREGYLIKTMLVAGKKTTVIAANSDIGVLYGVFRYLRLIQTNKQTGDLDIGESPKIEIRMLDHWDNLDRSVERGYAGQSIFDWWTLPDYVNPRYRHYARADASIGINGVALNNVNADPLMMTDRYLKKAASLGDVFRPYGIRVYLSVNFAAPVMIGGLKTADPLDPKVQAWWNAKADEIYKLIPDFGGFLVKANSEGQPGPHDYHRTHADGANMLADALKPHGGVVIWRAFVYASENPEDRAKQAYDDFKPLDGKFHDNVLIQVKNGPIDFQPCEPFHPLFGATPKTSLMMEFQVTKEYLGFATHLVYLGPLYEEVLKTDTYAKGEGSIVAKVIDGSLFGSAHTGMAGVANIGSDRNWTGSIFNQANWYVFGRMAWDPTASSRDIAEDWVRMTFTNDERFVNPVVDMMMKSREAVVDYMTPLGLAHLMGTGHHYGPAPWVHELKRPEWNPVYYHQADRNGIGFDRTKSGSDAIDEYAPPVAKELADPRTTPKEFLLWFHHLPWDYQMPNGNTLWDEIVLHYMHGVIEVADMRKTWSDLKGIIDEERYDQTAAFLKIQENEAKWWRDACIAYFQSVSKLPLPEAVAPPAHSLDYYESLSFPNAPGHQE